jgi:DNA repair exonuclease SbcCD nuclease subunit
MTIAGAKAQNHQQLGADGVTLGMYDIPEAGYKAAMLGHIHLRQQFPGTGSYFFYNGSIAALDYGETPDKYFSVLDTHNGGLEWIRLNTVHRQDIDAYWSNAGLGMDLTNICALEGVRVRVNLRVEGGDNVEAAKKQIEEFLTKENVLEFKINPQVLPMEAVRAVEISKSTSMKDKLTTYWEATTHPPEATQMGMLDKLSDLEDTCFL